MYESYYGFEQPPFSLSPDPKFLYRSSSHDIALQQVREAIRRREGFLVLTGDTGTGKTTLCRAIVEQLDPATFTTLVHNPFLSVDDLLRDMLLGYGVASRETVRSGRLAAASTHDLLRVLQDFLLSLVPLGGSAVLIIDEAHHLSPAVLEEIRIISNLETNSQKLLQIVLVGQLPLVDVLRDAKLRQLDQRISLRCLLQPLTREEVEAYVTHRLWVARPARVVTFTPRALDVVHRLSSGIPRLINLICDRALMAGSRARTDTITDLLIVEATRALGLQAPEQPLGRPRRRWLVPAAAALAVLGLAAAGTVAAVGNPIEWLEPEVPPAVRAPVPVVPVAARAAAPPTVVSLAPPPVATGAFSVLVGTYRRPDEATAAESALRARDLSVYAIDLATADGVSRRLLVGRFPTLEQATAVHYALWPAFPEARVISAGLERVP